MSRSVLCGLVNQMVGVEATNPKIKVKGCFHVSGLIGALASVGRKI
jgi:hypothetical protein